MFAGDDGNANGWCFSCKTYVANPYGEPRSASEIPVNANVKTPEEEAAEMAEIASYGVCDLPERKLRASSLDYYGIRIGLSEQDGKTPAFHYYPYTKNGEIVAYKVRLIEGKRMWTVGNQRDVDLFGWEEAIKTGARRLIITEGELDAVALYRIFEMYGDAKYTPPAVCSLPHGAASAGRDLARVAPKIRKHFKEVSFCFDADKAGKKALEDACKVLPEATEVVLPCKDGNQCLIDGAGKAAYAAAKFNQSKPKNSRLVWLDDVWEAAKEPPVFGVSWPWQTITDLTRGIRKGETIYIGAAQKMGKSEILNAIAAHLVGVHDWKVLLAKPEESNKKTVKLLAGKIAAARFHDPKVEFDQDAYDAAGSVLLGQKVLMLDLYQHMGWDSLKQDIIAAAALGVDAVFIDPITNLTNGMSASEANTKLQEIAEELAAMSLDLDIVVFIFCHLRNPDGGASHDRGGKVLTSQFAGSRAMGRSCHYMFGVEGNKDPELPKEERNVRKLVLLDDREFGEVGESSLYWNDSTTLFTEM